jgi:hypothetical protein
MCEIGKEVFHVVRFGADGEIALRRKIKRLSRTWRGVSAGGYQRKFPRYLTAGLPGSNMNYSLPC